MLCIGPSKLWLKQSCGSLIKFWKLCGNCSVTPQSEKIFILGKTYQISFHWCFVKLYGLKMNLWLLVLLTFDSSLLLLWYIISHCVILNIQKITNLLVQHASDKSGGFQIPVFQKQLPCYCHTLNEFQTDDPTIFWIRCIRGEISQLMKIILVDLLLTKLTHHANLSKHFLYAIIFLCFFFIVAVQPCMKWNPIIKKIFNPILERNWIHYPMIPLSSLQQQKCHCHF